MQYLSRLVTLTLLGGLSGWSQPQTPLKDKIATVYVYRYKQFTGSALTPSVYCDEVQVARIQNGSYFRIEVPPGRHSFRSNDKQAGVDVELKAGEEYYLRVELVAGMMKGHGRIVLAQKEQGSFEVKKLRPMAESKVQQPQ